MSFDLMEKAGREAERERERLASGKPPEPRIKHKVQRTAAKALGTFFILMLVLTLLARAADGVTVAQVQAQTTKTGVLTQRVNVSGTLEALGDVELTLPGGLRVEKINVSKGQRVQAGETLLELDGQAIQDALEKLRGDLALLDLKIEKASGGTSSADSDAVLNAQDAVAAAQDTLESAQAALAAAEQTKVTAQEDYDRLKEGRGTTEERAGEDLEQAKQAVADAEKALEKAKVKAKEDLIKAAQDKVDAAKEAQEAVEESAADAKEAAQQSVDAAQDSANNASDQYYVALNSYNRAVDAVNDAKEDLDKAIESGDEAAISTARSALLQAQSSRDMAESSMSSADSADSAATRALKRAKSDQKKVEEKWAEKLEKAKADLEEAQSKLDEAEGRTDLSEESVVTAAQSALDSARRTLQSAERAAEDAGTSTEDQLLAAQRAIDSAVQGIETAQRGVEAAQRGLESAQRGVESAKRQVSQAHRTDADTQRQAEIERLGYINERRQTQRQYDELSAVAENGGRLTAPAAGTVLSILENTGLTQAGAKVAALSRSDEGAQFKGKVDQKEAEHLSVGDEGNLGFTVNGKSQDLRVQVAAIGAADEKGMVEVTALLPEGTWPTGASAKLECAKRSEQYQSCLPISALRSDSDGEFVLVLQEKQTVMGTEQTVEKVPVEVEARDSQQMALKDGSTLMYDDRVITSSNKPIAEGDRVRLVQEETA